MDQKSRVISATELAAVSNISNLTNDRIEALAGGHGMVNMSILTVANAITTELLKGTKLSIEFADARSLPVDDIMQKAINVAKKSGCDSANAALIVASMMYLAGSSAQVGIPAGNRKLGATARMLAGVDRCGVAAVPTAKMNNKISALPAVTAVYNAMMKGELTQIDGRKVPANVGGGPLYGHSTLGEDIVWPEMATNGARIGTQAMLDAMAGAAMVPHPFTCAIFGAAAILEIIHPDAEVPEGCGKYGRTTSVYLVGQSAVKTAGLPEKLHMKLTDEEYDTAALVGDLGLIIKDIGGPSVIGMMAFDEIFACFKEGISGFSGGPVNAPLGHVGAYAPAAMRSLVVNGGNFDETEKQIAVDRTNTSFNPEVALFSINTIARKAAELYNGPVTTALINGSEPSRVNEMHRIAEFAYDEFTAGKTLDQIIDALENQRIDKTLKNASKMLSGMVGSEVEITIQKLTAPARRTGKTVEKYWSFDALVDITVRVGENTAVMPNFVADIVPAVAKGEREDVAWAVPLGAAVMDDLSLNACCIYNIVIPAGIAAAMKKHAPKEAADIAEASAWFSRSIPGGKKGALSIAKLALSIIEG